MTPHASRGSDGRMPSAAASGGTNAVVVGEGEAPATAAPCAGCGRTDDPKADCLADLVDQEVIVLADGRRVLSVNGQGHFPLPDRDAS
jgi:hypothetical protein